MQHIFIKASLKWSWQRNDTVSSGLFCSPEQDKICDFVKQCQVLCGWKLQHLCCSHTLVGWDESRVLVNTLLTKTHFWTCQQEHERVHQPGPSPSSQKPRVFNCSSCVKAFAKRSQLERHNRTHTGKRITGQVCTANEKIGIQIRVHRSCMLHMDKLNVDLCLWSFSSCFFRR